MKNTIVKTGQLVSWTEHFIKKLIQSENGILFQKNEAISLNLNADGISTLNKSKITILPFYLTINEIRIEERFLVENMVLAGQFKFCILSN